MARRIRLHSTSLDYTPVEVLSYNPRRIHAHIYADTYNNLALLCLGCSSQQAESAAIVSIYNSPLLWDGIDQLWARIPSTISPPQGITVLELVEE